MKSARPAVPDRPWLSITETAEALGVSVRTVCRGIIYEQSIAAVDVVNSLNLWLSDVRQTLNERHWSGTVANICDDLIDWPVITSLFVQEKYSVSAPTAKSSIDRLMEIGVLEELTGRPSRQVYGAIHVIKAVEAL